MRFRTSAVALGLGALVATPSLALTIQAAPPRPDIAQHLRSTSPPAPAPGMLPGPGDLQGSFVAPGRPQFGSGLPSPNVGTTSFSVGPVRGATTVTPGYDAFWSDSNRRDSGNPLSLSPPRR